jgi:7-keto-8-aminopelargonate synthetase-like enzyme
LREFLLNRARSFIFSTAPPAPLAAVARAALRIARSAEGDALREALWSGIATWSEALESPMAESAILPIVIGGEESAVQMSRALLEKGFLVPAIRYPTVAKGSARLRVTITSGQTRGNIWELAEVVKALTAASALRPRSR